MCRMSADFTDVRLPMFTSVVLYSLLPSVVSAVTSQTDLSVHHVRFLSYIDFLNYDRVRKWYLLLLVHPFYIKSKNKLLFNQNYYIKTNTVAGNDVKDYKQ